MSRTDKDSREAKREHWFSTYTPSVFNKDCRRAARAKAKQDLRNGREPQPRYGVEREWYW